MTPAHIASVREQVRREVLAWPGVEEAPHRFGGVEFRLGRRELGHLHGDRLADLPFPVRVREELVRDGRAQAHHILPESGWVSYPIPDQTAVPGLIALFRLAYDRATAARGGGGAAGVPEATDPAAPRATMGGEPASQEFPVSLDPPPGRPGSPEGR